MSREKIFSAIRTEMDRREMCGTVGNLRELTEMCRRKFMTAKGSG